MNRAEWETEAYADPVCGVCGHLAHLHFDGGCTNIIGSCTCVLDYYGAHGSTQRAFEERQRLAALRVCSCFQGLDAFCEVHYTRAQAIAYVADVKAALVEEHLHREKRLTEALDCLRGIVEALSGPLSARELASLLNVQPGDILRADQIRRLAREYMRHTRHTTQEEGQHDRTTTPLHKQRSDL